MKNIHSIRLLVFLFCVLGTKELVAGSIDCDMSLSNGYGPWDFFDPKSHAASGADPMGAVKRVTNVHLTSKMLLLKGGNTSGTIDNDLDYTLRAIPNHPQALDLASRLEFSINNNPLRFGKESMAKTADCYFQRAIKFTPQHAPIYMLYGIHKHRGGQYKAAVKNYRKALNRGYESTELHYNLGLAYFKLEEYDKAKEQAVIAYEAGYPLAGLRQMLKTVSIDIEPLVSADGP